MLAFLLFGDVLCACPPHPTPTSTSSWLPFSPSVRSSMRLVVLSVSVLSSGNGEGFDFPVWVDAVQNRGYNKEAKTRHL